MPMLTPIPLTLTPLPTKNSRVLCGFLIEPVNTLRNVLLCILFISFTLTHIQMFVMKAIYTLVSICDNCGSVCM